MKERDEFIEQVAEFLEQDEEGNIKLAFQRPETPNSSDLSELDQERKQLRKIISKLKSKQSHFEQKILELQNDHQLELTEKNKLIQQLKVGKNVNPSQAKMVDISLKIQNLKDQLHQVKDLALSEKAKIPILFSKLSKITEKQSLIATTALKQYKQESSMRKILHNKLHEVNGNVRLLCRTFSPSSKMCCDFSQENVLSLLTSTGEQSFYFQKLFLPSSSQDAVFEEVKPLATSVVDGYNASAFVYGVSGSGKTHTFVGSQDHHQEPGILPMFVEELFQIKESKKGVMKMEFKVGVVYMTHETPYDLLSPNPETVLDITKAGNSIVFKDQNTVVLSSPKDIESVITFANESQLTMDKSHGHVIYQIFVTTKNSVANQVTESKMCFVEFAPAELYFDSKQPQKGDKGLLSKSFQAFWDVLAAIVAGEAPVPYRGSKFTYVLQDCLGGNAKTLLFLTLKVAPHDVGDVTKILTLTSRLKTERPASPATSLFTRPFSPII